MKINEKIKKHENYHVTFVILGKKRVLGRRQI